MGARRDKPIPRYVPPEQRRRRLVRWNVVFWGCVFVAFGLSFAHGVLRFIGLVVAMVGLSAVGIVKSTERVRRGKKREVD